MPIRINPVRYNPVTQELRIAHRIEVEVRYEGYDNRNTPRRPAPPISPTWAKLMKSAVVNFDDVIDVDSDLVGSYLVICENDAELIATLEQKLLDWKRRMGYSVVLQTFNPGTSNSSIKNIWMSA